LGENNIDYDTVALSHFLFDDKTKPSGYSLTTTVAYPNDAEAFDSVMVPPADPRPMEELFKHLEESGRELRLRQDMANDADDSAPELRYAIVLFDSPEHAANALTDPSLLDFVLPDAQVSPLTVPNLGDASAGYTIDETRDPEAGPDRALLMAWQRGRVVLTASANGSLDATDAALPAVTDLANRGDKLFSPGSGYQSSTTTPVPDYLVPADKRLPIYKAAAARLLADDALGDEMTSTGVSSIPNSLLILDSWRNVRTAGDVVVTYDEVLHHEQHLLGVSKEYDQTDADPDSPISQFPSVSVGYHLYANGDAARAAIDTNPAYIALRVNEEITLLNDPSKQQLAEAPLQTERINDLRVLIGHVTLDDGAKVDLYTSRWRHNAVELFVDVAVPAGTEPGDLVRKNVTALDIAYATNPIPGY